MAAFNFAFVDQVLPRSNARLRSLLIDIGRKKPTFELREQVINEVPPSQYFLRASRIDAATGRLQGVTIYDVGGEASRRIIYADSGAMAYAEGQTDLSLRLYDGSIHQYRPAEPTRFQLTYFTINDIRVKNVFDELQRNTSESIRGDREMSTCEMLSVIHDARRGAGRRPGASGPSWCSTICALLLGQPPLPAASGCPIRLGAPGYCGWLQSVPGPSSQDGRGPGAAQGAAAHGPAELAGTPAQTRPLRSSRPEAPAIRPARRVTLSSWSEVATATDRVREADRRADRYAVEVHKKWAISLACISFVIIGHRDGAPVPPGRHRAGDRRRAPGVLHPLCGAHRRGEPGRPGPRLALGWPCGRPNPAHRPGTARADSG